MLEPATLAVIALKTSLVIVAAGAAARLMAKRSAAWRHVLWASALALSLLMPLAVAFMPVSIKLTLPWQVTLPGQATLPVETPARVADATPDLGTPGPTAPAAARPAPRAAWPTAMTVWLIGALLVALRNLAGHVGLIRWARTARPGLSPAWAATLRRLSREADLRRPLRVLESDRTNSACTWGFLRPVILLPAAGAAWPEPQRRYTLLHELAHVRRLDYLTGQVAALACAVHWFNPLVWLAAAQARKLQEQAGDDAVLNAGETPSGYAEFLVSIASDAPPRALALLPAVGMAQRSQLHGRVDAILDASRVRRPMGAAARLASILPLAVLALGIAAVSAVGAPAPGPAVPLTAAFDAIELRNGGYVTLVPGDTQRVTVRRGDPAMYAIAVRDGGRLVIDRCGKGCSQRHDFEVEVATPGIAAVAVAEGGTIESRGEFPTRTQLDASVRQGGTLDIRAMPAARVAASVYSGGRIFTRPAAGLAAQVEQGGNVTYWGDAVVESEIRHGGVVVRGDAADADRPLAELEPKAVPPIPAIPAIPAQPAMPARPPAPPARP